MAGKKLNFSKISTDKAFDRVMHHLRTEHSNGVSDGERVPSVRILASAIGVSPQTVQKAFKQLEQEGLVRSEIGNGTFWKHSEKSSARIRVAIAFAWDSRKANKDWKEIAMGVLEAGMSCSKPVYVVSIGDSGLSDGRMAPELVIAEKSNIDGLILFPYVDADGSIARGFEKEKKPVVFLNPPSEIHTADFVSFDYYGAGFSCGKALREAGRRSALLLMSPSLEISCSNRMRCSGFFNGFKAASDSNVKIHLAEAQNVSALEGERVVSEAVNSLNWKPDCVFCPGDYLAEGALKALLGKGFKVPEDVSIIGSTGLRIESNGFLISVLAQPLRAMGESLLKMLVKRIDSSCASEPGQFKAFSYSPGSTSTAIENSLLEKFVKERAEYFENERKL